MNKILELLKAKSAFYTQEADRVRDISLSKYNTYTAKRAECDDLIFVISNNQIDARLAQFEADK